MTWKDERVICAPMLGELSKGMKADLLRRSSFDTILKNSTRVDENC